MGLVLHQMEVCKVAPAARKASTLSSGETLTVASNPGSSGATSKHDDGPLTWAGSPGSSAKSANLRTVSPSTISAGLGAVTDGSDAFLLAIGTPIIGEDASVHRSAGAGAFPHASAASPLHTAFPSARREGGTLRRKTGSYHSLFSPPGVPHPAPREPPK